MICPKCGYIINNSNALYCPACGSKITTDKADEQNNLNTTKSNLTPESALPERVHVSTQKNNTQSNSPRQKGNDKKQISNVMQVKQTQEPVGNVTTRKKLNFVLQIVIICLLVNILILFAVVQIAGQTSKKQIDSIHAESVFHMDQSQTDNLSDIRPLSAGESVYESSSDLSSELSPEISSEAAEMDMDNLNSTEQQSDISSDSSESQPVESKSEVSEESTSEAEIYIEQTFDALDSQPEYVLAELYREYCIVNTEKGNLNIRSGPSIDYEILGKAPKNSILSIVGYTSDISEWILVEYNDIIGWVSCEYLIFLGGAS